MKAKIFAVRDNKLSTYQRPFVDMAEIQAVRSFGVAAKDPNVQISHYPEDFELCCLGEFDDITGKITPLDSPKFIISAISLVRAEKGRAEAEKAVLEEEMKKRVKAQ